jgi:hypothetical protein
MLGFKRKSPKAIRPDRAPVTINLFFVRAGAVGQYGYDVSEEALAKFRASVQKLAAEYPGQTFDVYTTEDSRQTIMAVAAAIDLDAHTRTIRSAELSAFTHGEPANELYRLIRERAEEIGITHAIVSASLPEIEKLFPQRILPEGSIHHLRVESPGRGAKPTLIRVKTWARVRYERPTITGTDYGTEWAWDGE